MSKSTAKLDPWSEGVLMAASVLVATHDQPTEAATILKELGLADADCSQLDDFDKESLRKVIHERGITLRGL